MRVALASGLLLTGCTSVLGIDDNRYLIDAAVEAASLHPDAHDVSQEDASRDGGRDTGVAASDGGPAWDCLSEPPLAPPSTATVTFLFGNPASATTGSDPDGTAVAGIVVRACARLDLTCSDPLATSAPSNEAGRTSLVVPGGFDGYFEAPATMGFAAGILWHPPVQASETVEQAALQATLLPAAAGLVNVTLSPDAGTVVPIILDCNDVAAPGVHFTLSSPTGAESFFYLSDSVPSATATATDSTGGALLYNAAPGTITMNATNAEGQLVGSATTQVRAGWVTFIAFEPTRAKLTPP